MGDVVKLLTTTLNQLNDNPDIYIEESKKTGVFVRIGRCVDRYIDNGRYVRDCNPILNIFNNKSADILKFEK